MASSTTQRLASPPATNGARLPGPSSTVGAGSPRRSAPMALAGLTAVVLGALLFAGLYVGLDRRRPVLVVTRPVAAGALITAEDLGEAKASVGPSMALSASRRRDVVGKAAATGLVPGSLLAPSQVGGSSALQRGEALVGLSLKSGQFPAALRPGARVQVVDVGRPSGTADQTRPVVLSETAVVTAVGRPEASTGATPMSVSLPEREAAAVVAASAAGRASLVVLPAP
jgi:flagella basal body P-ring formation protein FlgA